MNEGAPVSLREFLEQRLDAEHDFTEARFDAMDDALQLARGDLDKRLEKLTFEEKANSIDARISAVERSLSRIAGGVLVASVAVSIIASLIIKLL